MFISISLSSLSHPLTIIMGFLPGINPIMVTRSITLDHTIKLIPVYFTKLPNAGAMRISRNTYAVLVGLVGLVGWMSWLDGNGLVGLAWWAGMADCM